MIIEPGMSAPKRIEIEKSWGKTSDYTLFSNKVISNEGERFEQGGLFERYKETVPGWVEYFKVRYASVMNEK